MHWLNLNHFAALFAASLLGQVAIAPAAEPAPKPVPAAAAPAGPKRPDRNLKFSERPSIPFSELHFANDELRRRAEQFHEQADALVAKQGRADRYKDMTTSNESLYSGHWSIIGENRKLALRLQGKVIDERDQFHSIEAIGWAESGSWFAEVRRHLGTDTRRDFKTMTVIVKPSSKPNPLGPQPRHGFQLMIRSVSVETEEGPLHYRLFVHLPHSTDADWIERLIYGSPEEFLQLASEDIETLRKQAKQELPRQLTVYDQRHVSSGEPPHPGPVDNLTPQLRAKVEAAIDARLDADLAVLKADYRDMHKAIQLAMPREMFESKPDLPK